MTNTPDFNDLAPPDELVQSLMAWDRTLSYTLAYRAGARHGWEQARQLWPEPITDRPPTEADFDKYGWIQVVDDSGFWKGCHWETPVKGRPWAHTPRWQPRQPSLQEQALEVLSGLEKRFDLQCDLSLIRRALEQAGEGQA